MSRLSWPYLWLGYLAAAGLSLGLGAALVVNQTAVLILMVVCAGAMAISAPATYWAIAAVVIAVTGRGLSSLGAPGIVSYLDIPLAWGALAAAFTRHSLGIATLSPTARRFAQYFVWFLTAITISWIFDGSQIQRLIFFIALWGEPWAIVAALLIDPPTSQQRAMLIKCLVGLLAIQIPITYIQAVTTGFSSGGDTVQGTIVGSGAGAHLEGALAVVGAMWVISQRPLNLRHIIFATALATIPVLSGAKQVLVAVPAVLLLAGWHTGRGGILPRLLVLTVCIYGAFFFAPGGSGYGNNELTHPAQSGKLVAAKQIWSAMDGQPVNIMVGLGPAESLSHAAFLTTNPIKKPNSPLKSFGIHPSAMALTAESYSYPGHQIDSFHSEDSSTIGLFGDIGILGIISFAAMIFYIIRRLRTVNNAPATGALYGILLLIILAMVQDWWEEPSITVFAACLVAAGLTTGRGRAMPVHSKGVRANRLRYAGHTSRLPSSTIANAAYAVGVPSLSPATYLSASPATVTLAPEAARSRLARLTSGRSRSSMIVLAMRLTSMTLNLVVQVVMARVMGLAAFGAANTALAVLNIVVIPAALGYDVAAIRYVALARHDQPQLRALTARFARTVLLGSLAVSALVAAAAVAEQTTGDEGLAIGLAALVVIAPCFALVRVGEGWLRGFGSVVRAQINSGVVIPVLSIVLLLAQVPFMGSHGSIGVAGAMAARAAATAVAGAVVVVYVMRRLGGHIQPRSELERVPTGEMHRAALVLCGVGFLTMVVSQIDIVAVSLLRGASAAGLYSAASRIALAMNVCVVAVAFVLAPHVAHLHAEGRRSELQGEISSATSWSTGLMLCACAVLIPASPIVLGVFGSGFSASAGALRILLLGQLANAMCGPVAIVLSMTDKQRLAMRALAAAAVIDVVLLATLIPVLGIDGAACATAICTVAWNVTMVAYARRELGVWVLPRFALRLVR